MVESSGDVAIIIKAPNQKIDDLLIHCNPLWTINELKNYLSQVYPSKPHPNGQKLIYCGKLLLDNAVVNEVLRSYSGQQNNTIHLVCASTKDNYGYEPTNKQPRPRESTERTPCSSSNQSSSNSQPKRDSLISSYSQYKSTAPPAGNNDNFHHETAYLMYTYMQYIMYYTQRSNRFPQSNDFSPETEIRTEFNSRQMNQQNNANANVDEERQANRDWLDWVYILSRLLILFTVVYFYSSPVRCIMVTAMALILYNLGMFRWRPVEVNILNNINNLNNNNNNNNNRQTEGNTVEEENNRGSLLPIHARFGWIKVFFNFIVSFLLSLVPDNRDN